MLLGDEDDREAGTVGVEDDDAVVVVEDDDGLAPVVMFSRDSIVELLGAV